MTGPDLIRLAHELAEHGGVHRLTNLVTAAVHVFLAHDRASWPPMLRVETGVGMSDKAVRVHVCSDCGTTNPDCWGDNKRGYCAERSHGWVCECGVERRSPEREEPFGGISRQAEVQTRPTAPGTGLAAKSVKPFCETIANPAPIRAERGERLPLPKGNDHG